MAKKGIQSYTFSKMLECSECGGTFCRWVTKAGTVVWACYRHFREKDYAPWKMCRNPKWNRHLSSYMTNWGEIARRF